MLQYITFLYNYVIACKSDLGEIGASDLASLYSISYKIVYWIIVVRDLACLAVLVIFQYRAASS